MRDCSMEEAALKRPLSPFICGDADWMVVAGQIKFRGRGGEV